jgi:hypothetical protein
MISPPWYGSSSAQASFRLPVLFFLSNVRIGIFNTDPGIDIAAFMPANFVATHKIYC